jgi:hypothetical protein
MESLDWSCVGNRHQYCVWTNSIACLAQILWVWGQMSSHNAAMSLIASTVPLLSCSATAPVQCKAIPDAEYPAFYPIGIKASCVCSARGRDDMRRRCFCRRRVDGPTCPPQRLPERGNKCSSLCGLTQRLSSSVGHITSHPGRSGRKPG